MQQVQAIQIAIEHHQAGRLAEAETLYRQVLAQCPDHGDALHLLGVLAAQRGQVDLAIDLIGRAVAVNPSAGAYRINLGNALREAKRFGDAADAFLQAVRLLPDSADAHNSLGHALREVGNTRGAIAAYRDALRHRADHADAMKHLAIALTADGQLDEAIETFRRVIRMQNDPGTLNHLAGALSMAGRADEAIETYQQALQLKPDSPELQYNLGIALVKQQRLDEAIAAFARAIELRPTFVHAYSNLGNLFKTQGRAREAVAAYSKAIEVDPDDVEAYCNLGDLLREQWELDASVAAFMKAIQRNPDLAEAHCSLAVTLTWQGKLDEAVAECEKAIALKPDTPGAYINLGNAYKDQGRLDDALAAYDRAMALKPDDAGFHSSRVYTIHFHPGYDATAIHLEHRRWNERHAKGLAWPPTQLLPSHRNRPDPDRRLKIGYVSPDFRSHPIGRFLEPLMRHHDHAAFEIFCYCDVRAADSWTDRFRALADAWRPIAGVSHEDVARLIARDGIDILIDLTMHMGEHRLLVFARRPAPVQLTYLAYCSTTGLDTIDYRLTDPYIDPPGSTDEHYSEKSIRLAETYWCYDPGFATPEPVPLPALGAGYVTFGCLNNFAKASQPALLAWCRLLRDVPRSRLVLHAKEGDHRNRVMEMFRCEGVDPGRLGFVGHIPVADYFQLYQEIDIGLDPFPYAGGTTTCDALWMGVPVVSLAGRTGVGRAGVSLLSNVGLAELIAQTEAQYVRIAAGLSVDLPRLALMRGGLRQRMRQSPLMDAPRFARNVEAAYRQAWRWKASRGQA